MFVTALIVTGSMNLSLYRECSINQLHFVEIIWYVKCRHIVVKFSNFPRKALTRGVESVLISFASHLRKMIMNLYQVNINSLIIALLPQGVLYQFQVNTFSNHHHVIKCEYEPVILLELSEKLTCNHVCFHAILT